MRRRISSDRNLSLTAPSIADEAKSFICACIDQDIHDPICLAVIAERNARLLAESEAWG